jgi:hypothetical protein
MRKALCNLAGGWVAARTRSKCFSPVRFGLYRALRQWLGLQHHRPASLATAPSSIYPPSRPSASQPSQCFSCSHSPWRYSTILETWGNGLYRPRDDYTLFWKMGAGPRDAYMTTTSTMTCRCISDTRIICNKSNSSAWKLVEEGKFIFQWLHDRAMSFGPSIPYNYRNSSSRGPWAVLSVDNAKSTKDQVGI